MWASGLAPFTAAARPMVLASRDLAGRPPRRDPAKPRVAPRPRVGLGCYDGRDVPPIARSANAVSKPAPATPLDLADRSVVATRYWHRLDDGRIQCDVCPRSCRLHEGQRGMCFVRARQDDQVVLTSYGRSSGFCVDPIEKKPLNHLSTASDALARRDQRGPTPGATSWGRRRRARGGTASRRAASWGS